MNKYLGIKIWLFFSGGLIFASLLHLFIFIIGGGWQVLDFEFLFSGPSGTPIGSAGGILPAIIGSLYFMGIAVLTAGFFALVSAVYLQFYARQEWILGLVRMIVNIMAGIPSIILGLFGYSFLAVKMGWGISLLTGGVVLGMMIFPYIELSFEKSLSELPVEIIESSTSLGVSSSYMIMYLAVPVCWRDFLRVLALGGSFALGAAAPILYTGGVAYSRVPDSILEPSMALPLHLYFLIGENISTVHAYGTALVLILLLLGLNSLSIFMGLRKR